MTPRRVALVVIALAIAVPPVAAHVPSDPGNNDSPRFAVTVTDAAKSWSYYDEIEDGRAQYYRVTVDAGERLVVSAFTPRSDEFTPSLVVMAPGLEGRDAPAGVTVPDGMGTIVVEGERPASPGYEPFAPSANYETAAFERSTDERTTYLVALYEPEVRNGAAGVAIGYRESFTPTEYATVPFSLVENRLWEGQSPALAVGPFALALVAGAGLFRRQVESRPWTVATVLVAAGGCCFSRPG
ncbi:hypothetical protein ACFQRB_17335 [Halobaculum litoreum]|uniref:Uncharacterized protein n=1 Tax=Halobaculum litoreum TaxID=3031998 RepID=A0ABD5XRH8_9EURY